MSAPDRPRPAGMGSLLRWAGGLVLLGGGVLLGLHVARQDTEPPHEAGIAGGRGGEQTGRGTATRPASRLASASGHEIVDLDGRLLGRLTLLLLTVAAIMVAAMIGFLSLARQRTADSRPPFTPEQEATISVPAPHLQADPLAEIARLDRTQAGWLDSYGRAGPGRVRIPIARAMALTAGHDFGPPP